MTDLVTKIIEYENGEMEDNSIIDFFSELIKSGQCWSLQGSYGRVAQTLIDDGYISEEGEVLEYVG